MEKIWRNTDITKAVPDLGLVLPMALQAPEFVSQFLSSSFLQQTVLYPLFPLDEIRAWLRMEGSRGGAERGDLAEILLGEEREAREAAATEGLPFDLADYEMLRMEEEDFDSFELPLVVRILQGLVEESDELRPAVEKESDAPFALSLGFRLPLPHANPRLSEAEIKDWLQRYGAAPQAVKAAAERRTKPGELDAMLDFDFVVRGGAAGLKRGAETGVLRVPVTDPRSGDDTDLLLSLSYPLAFEGYFLASFEGLARDLSLGHATNPPSQ